MDLKDQLQCSMDLEVHRGYVAFCPTMYPRIDAPGDAVVWSAMNARLPIVLWVEDNANDVVVMRQAFADAGIEVELVVAENAVLAFRYMEEREPYLSAPRPPALVLLDLNLPAMSGMVVLQELHKHVAWRNTPLVVLTSTASAKEFQECLGLGASECITKPSGYDGYAQVVDRLRRYLPRIGRNRVQTGTADLDADEG
jgi:CheY-like chemotaxis protein